MNYDICRKSSSVHAKYEFTLFQNQICIFLPQKVATFSLKYLP